MQINLHQDTFSAKSESVADCTSGSEASCLTNGLLIREFSTTLLPVAIWIRVKESRTPRIYLQLKWG